MNFHHGSGMVNPVFHALSLGSHTTCASRGRTTEGADMSSQILRSVAETSSPVFFEDSAYSYCSIQPSHLLTTHGTWHLTAISGTQHMNKSCIWLTLSGWLSLKDHCFPSTKHSDPRTTDKPPPATPTCSPAQGLVLTSSAGSGASPAPDMLGGPITPVAGLKASSPTDPELA